MGNRLRYSYRATVVAVLAGVASSCSGAVGPQDSSNTPDQGADDETDSPVEDRGTPGKRCSLAELVAPAAPLRRLTRREFDNTVRDLLADDSRPARAFAVDARPGLFEDNSEATVSALVASQYSGAAERLAATAVKDHLAMLSPCATKAPDDGCAHAIIKDFVARAYRRPLTDAEQNRLFEVYQGGRDRGQGFVDGVRLVLTVVLQSPNFINHVERGQDPSEGVAALTPYERASRLSYLIWGTMPDADLWKAAEEGRLDTHDDIKEQVDRMLTDSKAREGIAAFFEQWLRLDKVDDLDRSTDLFPQWNESLRGDFRRETEAFLEHVMWEGDAQLTTLLTAPFSFVNRPLGEIYGVSGGEGTQMVKTDLAPQQRSGLLTQASLLAISAHYEQTSPVHRGLQVREKFLCQHMPSPPPDVDISVPKPAANVSTRERFDRHREDPYCNGCHELMDPIGLGFENYDPIGRYRETENDRPVDASGFIKSTQDVDGAFDGAVELAGRLAESRQVQECMAGLWLAFGTGADLDDLECAAGELADEFAAADTSIRSLILSIAVSEAFTRRPAISSQECEQ